jgi:hypothetical protein
MKPIKMSFKAKKKKDYNSKDLTGPLEVDKVFGELRMHVVAPQNSFCTLCPWQIPQIPEKLLPRDRWLLPSYLLLLVPSVTEFQCVTESTLTTFWLESEP